MAVVLRLARHGQKKRPFYRIVAANHECARDGKYLEIVGRYNPMTDGEGSVEIKEERIRYWIDNGAKANGATRDLIKKHIPGLIEEKEEARLAKIRARREARKKRQGKAA